MKKISVVVPCYNEEKSVHTMHQIITRLFQNELNNYDYELIFADDYSRDNTRQELENICASDKKVKAVLNVKNFGFMRNVFASFLEATGDAVFMVFGDLQDPPELLPKFVERWEKGDKVILGQKISSEESKIIFILRTLYYKLISKYSPVEQVQHSNGFGLYDREFLDILHQIDDPQPYFKGIVGEFAMEQSIIQYEQSIGSRGYSNTSLAKAYDFAMMGITSYTKTAMRITTFIGVSLGLISLGIAGVTFFGKIFSWFDYPIGTASILIGVFFIGAVQLFFIGILGEYILSINTRMLRRPLTVARKINFNKD